MLTKALSGIFRDGVDDQSSVGSGSLRGDSIRSHCSAWDSALSQSRYAGRTRTAAKGHRNFRSVPSFQQMSLNPPEGRPIANCFTETGGHSAVRCSRRGDRPLFPWGLNRKRLLAGFSDRQRALRPHVVLQCGEGEPFAKLGVDAVGGVGQHHPPGHLRSHCCTNLIQVDLWSRSLREPVPFRSVCDPRPALWAGRDERQLTESPPTFPPASSPSRGSFPVSLPSNSFAVRLRASANFSRETRYHPRSTPPPVPATASRTVHGVHLIQQGLTASRGPGAERHDPTKSSTREGSFFDP